MKLMLPRLCCFVCLAYLALLSPSERVLAQTPAPSAATMEQTTGFLNTMTAHLNRQWRISGAGCQQTIRSEVDFAGQKLVRLTYLMLDQSEPLSVSIVPLDGPPKSAMAEVLPPGYTQNRELFEHFFGGSNNAGGASLYAVSIDKAVFARQQGTLPGPPAEWILVAGFYRNSSVTGVVQAVSATDFTLVTGESGSLHIPFDRFTWVQGPGGTLYQYQPPSGKKKRGQAAGESPLPPLTSFMKVGDAVAVGLWSGSGDPSEGLSINLFPPDMGKSLAEAIGRLALADPETLRPETQHPSPSWQPLLLLSGLDKETAERVAKATVHALVLCHKDAAPSPF